MHIGCSICTTSDAFHTMDTNDHRCVSSVLLAESGHFQCKGITLRTLCNSEQTTLVKSENAVQVTGAYIKLNKNNFKAHDKNNTIM